jgi:hypothetical protein
MSAVLAFLYQVRDAASHGLAVSFGLSGIEAYYF